MRGTALSKGEKPIIALTSRTKKGIPRIVPYLNQGAGVVTTRGHIHYVVTEYGTAYLYGKNLKQCAQVLISIAHREYRSGLERMASERFEHEQRKEINFSPSLNPSFLMAFPRKVFKF